MQNCGFVGEDMAMCEDEKIYQFVGTGKDYATACFSKSKGIYFVGEVIIPPASTLEFIGRMRLWARMQNYNVTRRDRRPRLSARHVEFNVMTRRCKNVIL